MEGRKAVREKSESLHLLLGLVDLSGIITVFLVWAPLSRKMALCWP